MTTTSIRVGSVGDPRLTNLVRLGTGEGFSTFTALFEGKPAFVVNCGTMNDFLDDDDTVEDPVPVEVFETDADRDAHVEHLRRTSPTALLIAVADE